MELYVHIPFCVRKCRYCDFISFPAQEAFRERYVDHLLREAALRSAALPAPLRSVETVYIGGGTPSLLPPPLFSRLVQGLKTHFDFSAVSEFTVEANPGTVTAPWAEAILRLGVTRVSLGMQAAQPHILQILGRIHLFEDVSRSVSLLRSAGLKNLSLDLMFGIPGQTIGDWQDTLTQALSLFPSHISAYGLIPEEGTPLYNDLAAGVCSLPDPELERGMYEEALSRLAMHDFKQYEISNFALTGCSCRHNIGYWTQEPYLGLGLSAASMFPLALLHPETRYEKGFPCLRQKNPIGIEAYEKMILSDSDAGADQFRESEQIGAKDACFETLMLGLRMNAGVSSSFFRRLHGLSLEDIYGPRLEKLAAQDLLFHDPVHDSWRLTRRGMDLQNAVLVELMD